MTATMTDADGNDIREASGALVAASARCGAHESSRTSTTHAEELCGRNPVAKARRGYRCEQHAGPDDVRLVRVKADGTVLGEVRGVGRPRLEFGAETRTLQIRITSEHEAELARLQAEGLGGNRAAVIRALIEASARGRSDRCEHGRPIGHGCCCAHGRADAGCPQCRAT